MIRGQKQIRPSPRCLHSYSYIRNLEKTSDLHSTHYYIQQSRITTSYQHIYSLITMEKHGRFYLNVKRLFTPLASQLFNFSHELRIIGLYSKYLVELF